VNWQDTGEALTALNENQALRKRMFLQINSLLIYLRAISTQMMTFCGSQA
jgi:hypothetical protein